MSKFCWIDYENHSEQILNVWPTEWVQMEHFFLTFWKNMIFPVSDSIFFFSKKFKFSKVKKKIIFDGVFELAIVDLVDTECFNFKNS